MNDLLIKNSNNKNRVERIKKLLLSGNNSRFKLDPSSKNYSINESHINK